MSANNFIEIKKKGKVYIISEKDADTYYVHQKIGEAKTLDKAVKMAQDYEEKLSEDGFYIEYGIKIR